MSGPVLLVGFPGYWDERFLTFRHIKDLPAEFPSGKTGSFQKPSSELMLPIRVVSRRIRVNSKLRNGR